MASAAVVYSKSNCVNCERTKMLFSRLGVPFKVVDIERDPVALQTLKKMNFLSAPVVVTDSDKWAGFNPQKIYAHASSLQDSSSVWEEAF